MEEKAAAEAVVTMKNILNAREDGEREGDNWDEGMQELKRNQNEIKMKSKRCLNIKTSAATPRPLR
jgi:hypothetical protein